MIAIGYWLSHSLTDFENQLHLNPVSSENLGKLNISQKAALGLFFWKTTYYLLPKTREY